MSTWNKVLLMACIILFLITPVHADNNAALMALLEVLHENGTIDASTYEAIRQVAKQGGETTAVTPDSVAESSAAATTGPEAKSVVMEQPTIDTRGKLEISSADGDFRFRVGGRLNFDGAFHDSDRTNLGDNFDVRRARLLLEGQLWRHWVYKLEYDFAPRALADAYLGYTGLGPVEIRLGHLKEPFSLQNMMSTNNTSFMERGLPAALTNLRNLGASVHAGGANWSAAAGVFGDGIDQPAGEFDQGYGTSARVTWAPLWQDSRLLHVGTSLAYRRTDQNDSLRFSSRPESNITSVRLVDTMAFPARDLLRYGVEAAAMHGPWAVQGEYIASHVRTRGMGGDNLRFDGYYVEASWFPTGESLNYNAPTGIFGVLRPLRPLGQGGYGAWQVATRFSSLDLNDGMIRGGRERNLTVGLNWYPNPNLRFMANYIRVLSVNGGAFANDEPDIFALRGQVVF